MYNIRPVYVYYTRLTPSVTHDFEQQCRITISGAKIIEMKNITMLIPKLYHLLC